MPSSNSAQSAPSALRPTEEADPDARHIEIGLHPESAHTKQRFHFNLPPHCVIIDWNRHNPIFLVAEPLSEAPSMRMFYLICFL